ncbi:MAG: hypothetical protein A3I68_06320 [Candidatus Melainabacteria bacterium RIFCSPLOWO2_02_FULL_35_15]|nr:MAG: hypothetical protein A3F80_08105 [Candidatus Melainabacteria bacterium RIFCSPLOWO2_12_FULL_35_11]OGI14606.1 MAG: hypothetical protein A3I68_06320 [Candidatus Melainabacteria bacterium RIFCSPLOWO2_02_FULL_35_15]
MFFYVVIFLLCFNEAYAYIDPGSGSYFFQIILASLIGVAFSLKFFWLKIVRIFKSLFSIFRVNKD